MHLLGYGYADDVTVLDSDSGEGTQRLKQRQGKLDLPRFKGRHRHAYEYRENSDATYDQTRLRLHNNS